MHLIEITSGELVDRLVISNLKMKHSKGLTLDLLQQRHQPLEVLYAQLVETTPAIIEKKQQLETINSTLWRLEDEIRSPDFAHKESLALKIIEQNDSRSQVKNTIDQLACEASHEFKSYSNV